jgi:hypothetical protein
MIHSNEMRESLSDLKLFGRRKLADLDVDSFIAGIDQLKVELSKECDTITKKRFGQTRVDKGIEISERFWKYFDRTNDPAVGFLLATTITHEIVHAFIRSGGLDSTPKKIRRDLAVKDAGYYAERKFFCRGLKLGDFGLQLFGYCKSLCKWFPGKTTLKNCRLGAYDLSRKHWAVLSTDYVNSAFQSGLYTPMESNDFEILRTPPGNIHIAGRVDEDIDEDAEESVPSLDFEILDEPPGNIHIVSHCIWEIDDDDDNDDD